MAEHFLRRDWSGPGYLVTTANSAVLGGIDNFDGPEWFLTWAWAPPPEANLRGHDAPSALIEGCRRIGVKVADLQPQDTESVLLRSDALGYLQMQEYDPRRAIAANE